MVTRKGSRSPSAEQRLKELGIKLPVPPELFGIYAEAVRTGNLLFLADVVKQQNNRMNTNPTDQQKRKAEATPSTTATRPPLPPFTRETAIQKVRLAEDGWNTRDPEKVALAYAIDSRWRNRAEFPMDDRKSFSF